MIRNRRLAAILAALVLIGALTRLLTGDRFTEEANMNYQQALAATAARHVRFVPGSPEEQAAIGRVVDFFANFTADGIRARTSSTYAEELYFNDTLKTIRSRAKLEEYLVESTAAVRSVDVEVQDVAVSDGGYYIRWQMKIRFERLAGGRETSSIGVSHIRFDRDGRVILHQDHWDSAAGLYEHVPVLGWMIRTIRGRV